MDTTSSTANGMGKNVRWLGVSWVLSDGLTSVYKVSPWRRSITRIGCSSLGIPEPCADHAAGLLSRYLPADLTPNAPTWCYRLLMADGKFSPHIAYSTTHDGLVMKSVFSTHSVYLELVILHLQSAVMSSLEAADPGGTAYTRIPMQEPDQGLDYDSYRGRRGL